MAAQTSVWTVVAAVALSAVTSYFVGRQSATCREGGDAGRLADATRELTRAVDAWNERLAAPARLEPAHRPSLESAPAAPSGPTGAPRRVESDLAGAPTVARSESDAAQMLPRADLSRAAEFEGWGEKEEVRRRWMFLPESGLIATLGTPDQVTSSDAEEYWTYRTDALMVFCVLTRGRLTRVDVSKLDPRPASDDR